MLARTSTREQTETRLTVLATEINAKLMIARRHGQATLSALMDVGDSLEEAKKSLDHGQWDDWLFENFALSDRTARLYMQLAGHRARVEAKMATVAVLGIRGALEQISEDQMQEGREKRNRELLARGKPEPKPDHLRGPGLTTRAVTTPMAMADLGIAGIADIPAIVAPASAFTALAAGGVAVDLTGVTSKTVPIRVVDVNDAGTFMGQGSAIPVRQNIFLAVTIEPFKFGVIRTMSHELAEHSVTDCETLWRQMFTEAATLKLDSVALGNELL